MYTVEVCRCTQLGRTETQLRQAKAQWEEGGMLTEFYEMMERDGYNMPYLESLEAEGEPTMARSRQLVSKLKETRRATCGARIAACFFIFKGRWREVAMRRDVTRSRHRE